MEGARRTNKVNNSSKDLHFSWDRTADDGKESFQTYWTLLNATKM